MLLPVRVSSGLIAIVLAGLVALGCGKKEEEAVAVPLPTATVAPVKAVADPTPTTQPVAAATGGSAVAEGAPVQPTEATPPPAAEAPKGPPPSIDGCCSALSAMAKDAKTSAVDKSKATAAAAMCSATAKLVKDGKAARSSALTQIKATMAGSAPSACN